MLCYKPRVARPGGLPDCKHMDAQLSPWLRNPPVCLDDRVLQLLSCAADRLCDDLGDAAAAVPPLLPCLVHRS